MYELPNGLVIFFHPLCREFMVGWKCRVCPISINRLEETNCGKCAAGRPPELSYIAMMAQTFRLEEAYPNTN